jgi:hypothetical protein
MAWSSPKTWVPDVPLTAAEMNQYVRDNTLALYPTWTHWTPTFTGFSANPTAVIARYVLIGKMCYVNVYMGNAGTSNANTFTVSAPFPAAVIANTSCPARDGGTNIATGQVEIRAGESSFRLLILGSTSNWTTSGEKRARFQIFYEVA